LVQLHHKIETLEHLGKHLVLILQDHLLTYMKEEFCFNHLNLPGKVGDSMHFHSYSLEPSGVSFSLVLKDRLSTDAAGIATCLGLSGEAKVCLQTIISELERKISNQSLMTIP